jgi:hypothetical protein
MTLTKIAILSSAAALLIAALTADTPAQAAEGGPVWFYEARELSLTVSITSKGTNFLITLAATQVIECTTANNTGEILAGNPGTGKLTIKLSGCKLFNQPNCEIRSREGETLSAVGTIGPLVENTKLGYIPGTSKEQAGALLTPEAAAFVLIVIEKANCELKGEYEIKYVGQGAVIGKLLINKVPAKSGEESKKVEMEYPTTAIGELEVWNPTTKVFEKPKAELQYMALKVTYSGVEEMETMGGVVFGWKE